MYLPHQAIPQLQDFLHQSAVRLPTKVALVAQTQRLSYATIEEHSNALAHALVARGVGRGDRVMISAGHTGMSVIAFWAVLKANAVAIVVSPDLSADELSAVLNDADAMMLICDHRPTDCTLRAMAMSPRLRWLVADGAESERHALAPVQAVEFSRLVAEGEQAQPPARLNIDVDLAVIIYNQPPGNGALKGVMLTHRNMLSAAISISTYLRSVEDDVILNVLPLSSDDGLYQMVMAFRVGGRLILEADDAALPDLHERIPERIRDERVTAFLCAPAIFDALSNVQEIPSSSFATIRYVMSTAAGLSENHFAFLAAAVPQARVYSMYGMTECKRCTSLPPDEIKKRPRSVGLAMANLEMWIEDERGCRMGPGEVGQLVVRGASVMSGYWQKPEETAKRLKQGGPTGEPLLYTGDYCRMDSEGYLYVVGRIDDIMNARSEKIAPNEVEKALLNIVGVKDAAVIGVPDEILGQAVCAFVVIETNALLDRREIKSECHRRLQAFMVPKQVVLVRQSPKTIAVRPNASKQQTL